MVNDAVPSLRFLFTGKSCRTAFAISNHDIDKSQRSESPADILFDAP